MRSLLVVASLVLSACGSQPNASKAPEPSASKDSEPRTPTDSEPRTPTEEPQTAEDKLSRAQASTCAAVCDRLVQCSVDDAKANLSPEQVTELNIEQTAPAAVADCKRSCIIKPLSPKQLIIARECVNGPPECPDYLRCLDTISKGA